LGDTFTITVNCVEIKVAWAFLLNAEASATKVSVCGEKFLSCRADNGFAHAIANFLVENLALLTRLDDTFTAAPLDVPCFTIVTILWQASALAKGLVPNHDLVADVLTVVSQVTLTAAVIVVEVVVVFARLFNAQAGSVDDIPSVIGVIAVLHLISASAVIISFWLSPDECARFAGDFTGVQDSINYRYQMLCARLGKAKAICV
jgi:hypothetical protein